MSTQQSSASRLTYLDGIRGLACLMVVYIHMITDSRSAFHVSAGPEYWLWYFFGRVLDAGKVGVVLFFALSGFIIPPAVVSKTRPVLSFLMGRFFRLYPAYWLSLTMAILVQVYLQHTPVQSDVLIANVTMAQELFGRPNVLMVYWTLTIELIFYAVCVIHFLCGRRLLSAAYCFTCATAFLALSVLLAWQRHVTHGKVPVALPLALSVMHWASVWRAALDGSVVARRLNRVYLAVFFAILPLVSILAYNFDLGFEETWYRYTLSYYTGIGLFLIASRYKVFNSKFLVFIGNISYSVYLLHSIATKVLDPGQYAPYVFQSPHLYFLGVTGVTIVFSWMCFHLVERPGQQLGQTVRAWVLGEEPSRAIAGSPKLTPANAEAPYEVGR